MHSPLARRFFFTPTVDDTEEKILTDKDCTLSPYARRFFVCPKENFNKVELLINSCEKLLNVLEKTKKINFVNDVDLHFSSFPTLIEKEGEKFLEFPTFRCSETILQMRYLKRSIKKCKVNLEKIENNSDIQPTEIQKYKTTLLKIENRYEVFFKKSEDFRKEKNSHLDKFFLY